MRVRLDVSFILARMALRNLAASRIKTLVVGGITMFGAWLVVGGLSFIDSVDSAIQRSIVGSVAGHLQIYSDDSNEELDVMGGLSLEGSDIAAIEDFERVRSVVEGVAGVEQIVPMGISGTMIWAGNTLDLALAELRPTVQLRLNGAADAQHNDRYAAQKRRVRHIVGVIKAELAGSQGEPAEKESLAALDAALSEGFWRSFDADPLGSLEYLENKVAVLASDAEVLALRYIGTEPAAFASAFDRFKIVDGEHIPPGKRGFLFSKYIYESELKINVARTLDQIREGRVLRGLLIAQDIELGRLAREVKTRAKEVLMQFDERKADLLREELQSFLGTKEVDMEGLLAAFLTIDDANFEARYKYFYDRIAPSLTLYRVPVGSTITLKATTKSGYIRSVRLPVFGTFTFQGLEKSPQAGALNMMDLVSFRELYGFPTTERAQEIAELRKAVNVTERTRQSAEAALFGEVASQQEAEGTVAKFDLDKELAGLAGKASSLGSQALEYDPQSLRSGTVLNAAVVLEDPSRIEEVRAAIQEAAKAKGLPVRVVTWQKASGLTGQLVLLMRFILYAGALIIFCVALIILSNALVMATLERVQEFGTLRALGAQRGFVLAILLVEGGGIGLVFGMLGAALGAGTIAWLARDGIPAFSDVMTFFFSGDRLFPTLTAAHVATGVVMACGVSIVSCLYPGWIAMRVTPRQAMQSEE